MTDSIQAYGENKHLMSRWVDLMNMKVDTRTGDEIVLDVIRNAGLKPKGGEDNGFNDAGSAAQT